MFKPENTEGRIKPQGHFGIGIENLLSHENLGTLWRSAQLMGASYIFTIGKKYKFQKTDTTKAHKAIPLFQFLDFDEFFATMPKESKLVGIEIDDKAESLSTYEHFRTCIYLLGSESNGLSDYAKNMCHDLIYIPSTGCLNVSVTGSIVLYDRVSKIERNGIKK